MAPTAYAAGGGDVCLPYMCHLSVTVLHACFKYTDQAILRQHKLLSGDEDLGSRMKERIEKDQRVREEIRKVEGKLSLVKGLPFALP